jgi:hypothetical protein
MATVRMSNELKTTITRNANTAYLTANPEPKPSTQFEEDLVKAIKNMPYQETMRQIENIIVAKNFYDTKSFDALHFCIDSHKIDSVRLTGFPSQEGRNGRMWSNPNVIHLSTPLTILGKKYEYNHHSMGTRVFLNDLHIEDKPVIEKHVTTLNDRIEAHEKAQTAYMSSIETLLNNCNTLKQAVETWPGIESLVPSHMMQKMHEKITRKQRAVKVREEIHFDQDQVNQVVLTAKLLGG